MHRTALAQALILCLASTAAANVEIGGIAGLHVFDHDNELGVQDRPDAPSQRNSVLIGIRIGAFFMDVAGVEAELGVIPTVARESEFTVVDLTYRAHLVAQLRARDPDNVVIPFVFVGAGAFSVIHSKNELYANDPARNISEDTDATYYFGAGVKVRTPHVGFRLDARMLAVPSSENTDPPDPETKKVTADFEVLASVYLDFGRTQKPPPPPPPPRIDDDPDRDTVRGAADQCPDEPEDADGFMDDDGCPEPDNDADGIVDGADRCPNEAEDRDGHQDQDGCPETDNDGDGITDSTDMCPADPEDKDGFQDDDGCPELDNDDDGVVDAHDRCPAELETKNGYADDDGCPDEVPPAVVQLTGALQGINFRTNTAELSPASRKTLDAIVKMLADFGDVRVEIGAHTDDQPLARSARYPDNVALSQARAEAVRDYLVTRGVDAGRLSVKGYGDTAPLEAPTGLTGGKLRTARAKNRRIELRLVSALAP